MTIEEAIKNLDDNLYAGDVNNLSTEALEKALDVLEKVRDGKMIELPCKVGDKFYCLEFECTMDGCFEEPQIPSGDDCEYCEASKCDKKYLIKESSFWTLTAIMNFRKYIGKTIFLTKEEAEKALKERQK